MLKGLFESGKMYGYITDYYAGGKGIVIADSEQEARQKIISAYLKHGFSDCDFDDLQVWKVADGYFDDAPDVLEIWQ